MLYGNKEKIEETTKVLKGQENIFDWQSQCLDYSVNNEMVR